MAVWMNRLRWWFAAKLLHMPVSELRGAGIEVHGHLHLRGIQNVISGVTVMACDCDPEPSASITLSEV